MRGRPPQSSVAVFPPLNPPLLTTFPPGGRSGEKYTEAVDVYSLGVVIAECLLWSEPFPQSMSSMDVMKAVALEGRRPTIPPFVPRHVCAFITDLWDNEPEQRPTAAQAVEALARMLR